jgi:hypothetical protein
VAPSGAVDPGPHEHDGLPVTVWDLAMSTGEPVDARAAGRALRVCHEALEDFAGDLPAHAIFREFRGVAARLLARRRAAARRRRARRERRRSPRGRDRPARRPAPAAHGDAHVGDVVPTAGGPLWNDFEDTFRGPLAWDLACLHATARAFDQDPAPVAAAQDGYADPGDEGLLDLMIHARAYVGLLWALLSAPRRPDGAEGIARRRGWLRANDPPVR